jgi:phosphoribosylformimino-5-aminoimidazole carboxamide ribonucleotide (ProFAR) isomerase
VSALGEISDQLDELIRTATRMRDVVAAGGTPDLADARILRGQAQFAEALVGRALVADLMSRPERTPEQDKASQFCVDDVDELEKWSAA